MRQRVLAIAGGDPDAAYEREKGRLKLLCASIVFGLLVVVATVVVELTVVGAAAVAVAAVAVFAVLYQWRSSLEEKFLSWTVSVTLCVVGVAVLAIDIAGALVSLAAFSVDLRSEPVPSRWVSVCVLAAHMTLLVVGNTGAREECKRLGLVGRWRQATVICAHFVVLTLVPGRGRWGLSASQVRRVALLALSVLGERALEADRLCFMASSWVARHGGTAMKKVRGVTLGDLEAAWNTLTDGADVAVRGAGVALAAVPQGPVLYALLAGRGLLYANVARVIWGGTVDGAVIGGAVLVLGAIDCFALFAMARRPEYVMYRLGFLFCRQELVEFGARVGQSKLGRISKSVSKSAAKPRQV
jgi:hypothetical protein